MPVCATDSLTRVSSSDNFQSGSSSSSGFHSPTSPYSFSPYSVSPDGTLKKRRVRRVASAGVIVQEPFAIHSDKRESRCQSPVESLAEEEEEELDWMAKIIGWYPCFLLKLVKAILVAFVPTAWRQMLVSIPTWTKNFWLWTFWQVMQLPLAFFKAVMILLMTPTSERRLKKRTVLISGGSTVQALHLARNFYSAGARVIMCEVEGNFALTRFSTAVVKFYTLPKPNSDELQKYVRALCEIIENEKVTYYIPVSSTTTAYYDAVAKPHLELLGCVCFCPGIKEVWALDDTLEVLKRCEKLGIQTPNYFPVTSKEEVLKIYESGAIKTGKFVMSSAGHSGLKDKTKFVLPKLRADLKLPMEINEHRPWIIVQDVEGEHFLTCTTVKENKIIANVTCRLDEDTQSLIPVEHKEIATWLDNFFAKINLLRPVTGHVSFRFVVAKSNGTLIPLSSRVGVSLPYVCYTSVHPRLLWKPCKHFSRQSSGPLIVENGRYWMPETVVSTLKKPSVEKVTRLIGTVLDKREVLFTLWDPLPYCAYYHMQLPLKNILGLVHMQQHQEHFSHQIAMPAR